MLMEKTYHSFLGISWIQSGRNLQQLTATCCNQYFVDIFLDRFSKTRKFR